MWKNGWIGTETPTVGQREDEFTMAEHEYQNMDEESQQNQQNYHDLLSSIKNRMNPESNSVLLVDDERTIRRRVARDITKTDSTMNVFEAGNGQEALEKLDEMRLRYERDPLFIVLDLNMPVMDGYTFIEILRKEYEAEGKSQGIPIIVLSSTSGERGVVFRKTVHRGKTGYSPLVTVAKEACIDSSKYDASGEKGLMAWIKYFMRSET
jgi:CheY-like chemotaxis protein